MVPAITMLKVNPVLLARLTARRGWLKKTLAERAGVSCGPVSAALNKGRVSPPIAQKIADALGVPLRKLLVEDGESASST